jgi:hypothetical protein
MLLAVSAHAGPKAPTDIRAYDGFAPGSRAIAMGLAAAAIAEDSSAVYFNPAGTALLEGNDVGITYEAARQSTLSYDEVFSGEALRKTNLVFLGLASPQGSFTWRPLSNSRVRTANGSDWEEHEIKINAYTFTVNHKHNSSFYSGLNLSYLSGNIAQSQIAGGIPSANVSSGNGFAADLGFMYVVSPELHLGLTLQNLGGRMWWDDFEPDQLPFIARAGLAYQIAEVTTFAADWEKRYYRVTDGPENFSHFGFEQAIGVVRLRAGIFGTDLNKQEETHLTAGLGYEQNKYRLSLAGEKYRLNMTDVYRYVFSLDLPI